MEGEEQNSIHIIYFLSWMNRIEHPHVIRLDHHAPRDIRLQNVKRWLSDYRGKEFPESFAWSCKRKYKTGYVWQDLMDDDVITPLSDHEYVLQGSLISTAPWDYVSFGEAAIQDKETDPFSKLFELKKDTTRLLASQASNVDSIPQAQGKKQYHIRNNPLKHLPEATPNTKTANTKSSAQPRSASSVTSKHDKRYYSASEVEEVITDDVKNRWSNSSGDSSRIMNNELVEIDEWFMTSPSPVYSPPKRSASSNKLLSLLTCGVVETNQSTVKLINKTSSAPSDLAPRRRQRQSYDNGHWGIYCYDEVKKAEESTDKMRGVAAIHVRQPNCSQCGKCFKPEKLNKHMKACRGIKQQGKVKATAGSVGERMALQTR